MKQKKYTSFKINFFDENGMHRRGRIITDLEESDLKAALNYDVDITSSLEYRGKIN